MSSVHPECFGEDDKDIIGIWSYIWSSVELLLENTSQFESLVVKLERSNQQLVSLLSEQNQEIRGLREEIATSKRPDSDGDADANDLVISDTACGEQYALIKRPEAIPSRFEGNKEIRRHSRRYRTNDRWRG